MRTLRSALLAPAFLYSTTALAQSGYISPDGKSRYVGVTVFCPNGSGVTPCNFGGGGGNSNGDVIVNLGGAAVGPTNPFPVADSLLDNLIAGGVLKVGGNVSVSGTPNVTLTGALPAGSNTLGTISLGAASVGSVSLPGSNGAVAQAMQGISGGVPLSISGAVSQAGGWNVGVASLPTLPAGGNQIGSVNVNNFPASQTVSGSVSITGTPSVALAGTSNVTLTEALPAGSNTLGIVGLAAASVGSVTASGTSGSVAQAIQGIGGGVPLSVSGTVSQGGTWNVGVSSLPALAAGSNPIGSVSVSNFPASQSVSGTFWQATQPVSAASLPLPAGAALDSDLVAPYASVAPAAPTASKTMMIGCLSNTTLPSFSAGQEGAVPCDTSGRPYVVTVPSASNVPGYLQAVSSGGATPASATNAAASCMATNVKATSGMVYSYSVSNSNSSGVWFRLFASATAPTCGSGTPAKRIYVPAGTTVGLSTDEGWVFSTGIGYDVTSGNGADTDNATVAAANSVLVNVDYK